MKRILILLFLSVIFSPALSIAGGQTTIIQVDGYGTSYSEAIQRGLIEALKQAKGVSIDSQQAFAKSILEHNVSKDGHNSSKVKVSSLSQGIVKEATRGLINGYKVVDSQRISPGEWNVKLEVTMLRYTTPGISPHNRRKIAIIPFRTTKRSFKFRGRHIPASEISRQFTQKLVTEITQTRRFTVLDREYMEEFLKERNLVLSADAPVSEQMKVGEVLGVDYLLLGTISQVSLKQTPYTIQVTGESGYDYNASFVADYRIIVMATRQIKWSDSVMLSLGNASIKRLAPSLRSDLIRQALLEKAAKDIIDKAVANIYPLRVVQVQSNGEVILNQGGVTVRKGEILDVFKKGKKVIDPYTDESLGSSESWIAKIKITRVIPKMSYAKVIRGDLTAIRNGSICRRVSKKHGFSSHAEGRKSNIKIKSNGAVVLPFD